MPEKPKPAHKLRSGALTVTIWKNDGENGPWYSCVPSRSYKQGDQWVETNSYSGDDLLRLTKLLDKADDWIMNELAAAKAAERSGHADREERKRAGAHQR
ncbi:MAG TPA: hypothetical protein VKU02_06130 [Gemmataceae bacterium]|nr:hypothetical protein [Gemmataceae bacterium]